MFLRVCAWWLAIWFAYSAWIAEPPAALAPGAAQESEAAVRRETKVRPANVADAHGTSAAAPAERRTPREVAQTVAGQRPKAANPGNFRAAGASASEWIERNKRAPWFHSPQDLRQCRRVVVTATGYYAGPESTGKRPGDPGYGITFSGVRARRDVYSTIAADPALFPIGTELYVPGYGYAVVADTGSSVKGHVIDLYFERKDQIYREWGKRRVEVVVLRLGDGKLTEEKMNRYNDLGGRREVASPGCF